MTTSLTLHAIGDDLQEIAEMLVENGGELTPELEAQLAAIEGAFEAKVERVLLYARNLDALGGAAKVEATRIAALASSRFKAAERLELYVHEEMKRANRLKIVTALIAATVVKNGRPKIDWSLPIEELDKKFVRTTHALDGNAAYAAWQADPKSLPEGFVVKLGTQLRVR